jgi:hypothetical protein
VDCRLKEQKVEETKSKQDLRTLVSSPKLVHDRIRQLTLMTKSGSSDELSLIPNPNLKKSPLYVNPNMFHFNSLFGGITVKPHQPSDEVDYYVKVIRSLASLKSTHILAVAYLLL